LKVFGEHLGTSFEKTSRRDIELFMSWLRGGNYRPHTVEDYIMAVKRFYKFVVYGNVDRDTPFPDSVKWLRKSTKPNERTTPEFLTDKEVESMIKVANHLRDKTMLSVGYEAGLRASELLTMSVGDVIFDDLGARIKVKGKTGERTIRLICSSSLLSRYLETHPFKESPSMPLWGSLATNRRGRSFLGRYGIEGSRKQL
jgi:site-specific recombinase XerD